MQPPASDAADAKPAGKVDRDFEDERWLPVLQLPCQLTAELPIPEFRIANLMRLRAGGLVNTTWPVGNDIPLRINGTLIGWSEFEVVGDRLAVRLTELA
jgi:flagellar motor switch/type III secretory pathway protein FliN